MAFRMDAIAGTWAGMRMLHAPDFRSGGVHMPLPMPPHGGGSPVQAGQALPLDQLLRKGMPIETWHLEEEKGIGGMAIVWSAAGQHPDPHQEKVAVKIFNGAVPGDRAEALARFRREFTLLDRLKDDTHFVNVHGLVLFDLPTPGNPTIHPAIIMELLDPNTTLAAYLKQQRKFTPIEVAEIGADIARGMVTAHNQESIHRDLKPENIFWVPGQGVKIADLGIAANRHLFEKMTRDTAGLGTPFYAPPEQTDPGEEPDKRMDIYSLAVVERRSKLS